MSNTINSAASSIRWAAFKAVTEAKIEADGSTLFPGDVIEQIAKSHLRAIQVDEREACAKIADARAAICGDAIGLASGHDASEVHCLNEALHIAQLIRNRS